MLRKQFISNLAKMVPAALVAPQVLLAKDKNAVARAGAIIIGTHAAADRFGQAAVRYAPAMLEGIRLTEDGFELTDIFGKTTRSAKLVVEGGFLIDSAANRVEIKHNGTSTAIQLCCSKAPQSPVLLAGNKEKMDEPTAERFINRKGQSIMLLS